MSRSTEFFRHEGHHLGPRGHGAHFDVGPADDRLHVLAERGCVAGDQDGLHRGDTIGPVDAPENPASSRLRAARHGQEKSCVGGPLQPEHLVHVLAEERDPADRGRRHLRRQPARTPAPPGPPAR